MRTRDLSSPLKPRFSSSSIAAVLGELNPLGDRDQIVSRGWHVGQIRQGGEGSSKLPVAFWDLL